MVPVFVFCNFAFKVCNTAWIMPSFCNCFYPFYWVVLEWNIQWIWKIIFIHFSEYLPVFKVKPIKNSTYFNTEIYYPTKNDVHMAKLICIRMLKMDIFETKTLSHLRASNYWTNRNGKKTQQFNHFDLYLQQWTTS